MEKWRTKIFLSLLFLVFLALYFEIDSVKTINQNFGYSETKPGRKIVPSANISVAKVKSRLAVGERYASLNELVADQRAVGYLKIGYFGENWPANVTEITSDNDGITFVKRDGTRHNYTDFEGYRIKVVRLIAEERETIIVFRSKERR